jgi:hypothetical protein
MANTQQLDGNAVLHGRDDAQFCHAADNSGTRRCTLFDTAAATGLY